jgi:cyclin A
MLLSTLPATSIPTHTTHQHTRLVEVVDEYKLSQESLFLAVSLLDRFLSRERVRCRYLQLLGVTCLWVAAKFEEVLPPSLQVCCL